ncbi:keratin, type I cytoskeletal 19-like [Leucoraja erinacea]|uniref:keratin, type I cytoskeletal 19-like n=1 Tax=Leucoraja erinaceus TaxID=7782 RepID=UPI002455AC36|nr:keratin, type I cytoskeletal 19-like [Leucoraja erinacea]
MQSYGLQQDHSRQSRRSGSVVLSSNRSQRMSVGGAGSGGVGTVRRAASVYNTPRRGTRISSSYAPNKGSNIGSFYSGQHNSGGLAAFSINEKQTMQNLNERLATYLNKVHSLEKSNHQYELQIREFYDKRSPADVREMGDHWKTISSLRAQINAASLANAKVLLQIDNAKLAADDFKTKYDSELAIRRGVEMDIAGLRKVLDELTMARSDLESQIEAMKEELIYIRKSHDDEMKSLRHQLRGTVTVEVDAPPAKDLTKTLAELRSNYELMAENNQLEAEKCFKEQSSVVKQTMSTSSQQVSKEKEQYNEQRRKLQSVEIDVHTLMTVKSSLEANLQDTEEQYADQLLNLEDILSDRDAELSQIQMDMQRQSQDYTQLLDIKTRLEMEIAQYRRLLDGEHVSHTTEVKTVEVVKAPEVVTTKKYITVTETLVDGQVVDSREEVQISKQ